MTPRLRAALLPAAVLLALLAGAIARASDPALAQRVWFAGLLLTGVPLALRTLLGALRGRWAADLVAALAITGAILLREPLAGLVIVLMQSGGEFLEAYAAGRASEAVRALEAAAPRQAHRLEDGGVRDIPAEAIAVGDRLLVRPGDLVPCDALVVDGRSRVDTAAITGEPLPRDAGPGTTLLSGMANLDGALTVRATAIAAESQYARIVELVRSAQASKAPLQRVADRFAVWFTPLTLAVCGVAWAASGDPTRALAVLVVATPCPLILAAPVAFVGGINAAARRRIIVRHGAALERLAQAQVAVFDKTGTLTVGRPEVQGITALPPFGEDELLALAGAVEEGSSHQLARPVVQAARARLGTLPRAEEVVEWAGQGIGGRVAAREVRVGSLSFLREQYPLASASLEVPGNGPGQMVAGIVVDGQPAGLIRYADQLRAEAREAMAALGALGFRRTLLLSGDAQANARRIAAELGIADAHGDLLPEQKVEWVKDLEASGVRTLMVGDGTNDAPALSAATVGVALAEHGGGITAQAADVVILTDDLRRVPAAVAIGRHTMRIARQSIWIGVAASSVAMLVAAAGYIPPTLGALIQEVIDAASILNALRAARGGADTPIS